MQTDTIHINIQGEDTRVPAGSTIKEVLALKKISDLSGLAVAVDQHVVPKSDWDSFVVPENAEILLIRATQGG